MEKETKKTRKKVIEVKNLYKIYRVGETKVRALNGVDFSIYKGEFCAIVGTSGSGKSTLLNMLAGLERPTKGEIVIAGEHIERKSENKLVAFRRQHIGFIFQSFNLMATMNAIENVALPLSFQGVARQIRNKKAEEMLDLVGLSAHKKHRPTQMSGGQQQRVGIARALVVNPEIIFADEPTGNLDSRTSAEVMELIKKIIREQNQTLVMVTHDDHLAQFADRIFRISDGKIISIEEGVGAKDIVDDASANDLIIDEVSENDMNEKVIEPQKNKEETEDLEEIENIDDISNIEETEEVITSENIDALTDFNEEAEN